MEYRTLKYTVVNRIDLGRTRIAGYTLFNPADVSFMEMTPGQVKNLIQMKQVNGLKMDKGEIVIDPDFGQDNLIIKSGVGNYRQLIEMPDRPDDLMLSLTKPITDLVTGENVYEVVTNRCARVCITEPAMFDYVKKGMVAGCDYILDENDNMRLLICDGVDVSDYHPEEPDAPEEPVFEELIPSGEQENTGINVFDELLAGQDEDDFENPESQDKKTKAKPRGKTKAKKATT